MAAIVNYFLPDNGHPLQAQSNTLVNCKLIDTLLIGISGVRDLKLRHYLQLPSFQF